MASESIAIRGFKVQLTECVKGVSGDIFIYTVSWVYRLVMLFDSAWQIVKTETEFKEDSLHGRL